MEFLKKHYEKVILSVVLAGLAVAAALLPLKVSSVRNDLEGTTRVIGKSKNKPVKPIDLSTNEAALKRLRSPQPVQFSAAGHQVFNPIMWVKGPGGRKIPKEDTGLASLSVTNIVPLKTEIQYRGTRESGVNFRYEFLMMREASTNRNQWQPFQRIVGVGDRPNEVFQLKEIRGPKENPTELVLELVDTRQTVAVSKEKPFSEIAGFAADLRHDVEGRVFSKQRQGQKITIGGVAYNIVAISQSDVTLEDSQSKKRTTIRLKAAQ
jgi:hypothetical protein